jgi:YegS/Rv2252/BmrU family lipid kinase
MSDTLVIVNPRAGTGRAGQLWPALHPLLDAAFGGVEAVITDAPGDVYRLLMEAAGDVGTVISVGGDGTNHAVVNALAEARERRPDAPSPAYGTLPVGTGRDWARGLGMPLDDPPAAVRWLGRAKPLPTDVGLLIFDDRREYFLNIGSAGLGYEVSQKVNRAPVRRPWTFLAAIVGTLVMHRPRPLQIVVDGQPWYDGKAYVVVVANGRLFAHGMKVAPDADVRDGLLDVVLVMGASRAAVLRALPRVYAGTHLTHPAVRFVQARQVDVSRQSGEEVGVELDGEPVSGRQLSFRVRPGLLNVLAAP